MKFSWPRSSPDVVLSREEGAGLVRASLADLLSLSRSAESLGLHFSAGRAAQSGSYVSRFKGRGMEFDEVRLYQSGDDVRSIDWRVTARSGQPHTKLFREERERPVFIAVDYRASMFFATRGVFKAVQAARFAALVAWSATHHGDRVGGQVFSEHFQHDFKPLNGRPAVLRFLNYLVEPGRGEPGQSVDDEQALMKSTAHLSRLARPGSLVVLLSDFRKLGHQVENHLMRLARHCEVVLVEIHDPLEAELPPGGRYRVGDGRRELTLDTGDGERVRAYQERFARRTERLNGLARRGKMAFIQCETVDDPLEVLQQGIRAFRSTQRGR